MMASSGVYLDCAASAPIDEAVSAKMRQVEAEFSGNPASVHAYGVRATRVVEKARLQIAERMSVSADELFFTSGGTEANNWVLKGAVWGSTRPRKHLVVSAIEHPSVLQAADWLQATGQAEVTRVDADHDGVVTPAAVAEALRDDTILVSVLHVNNETGVVQPLEEIGKICRARGVWLHTDACQSFLKERLEPKNQNLDFVTLNAHKVHGPKGVGALYVRAGLKLAPLFHGGGHEGGRRSGTLNTSAISGFGEAVSRYAEEDVARMRTLLDHFTRAATRALPGFGFLGARAPRTCNILNFSIAGRTGKDIFQFFDRHGVMVSTSSACHSTQLTPSHVLKSMGLSDDEANAAVRLSIGRFTTEADMTRMFDVLKQFVGGER